MSDQIKAADRSRATPMSSQGDPVDLNGRYRLFPGLPLPELDSPSARAYLAEDPLDPGASLFAVICRPTLPARLKAMQHLRASPEPGHLRLLDYGSCLWPPLGRRVIAAVLERPQGERLPPFGLGLSGSELLRRVVAPVVQALRHFHERGLTHRAVRPDNMFWADPRRQAVVLGECVTAPPGYDQPTAFETIENGLAHPAGRSEGTVADDLYALGVSILRLSHRSPLPVGSETPDSLLIRKLELGSAVALIGDSHPPPELMPLLRGLLCDETDQRWSLEAVESWLRNDRMLLPRPAAPRLAARPYRLGEGQYRTARSLALGLWRAGPKGAADIRSGAVEQWLRSSLRDEATAEAIQNMRRSFGRFGGRSRRVDDALVARACILLDPGGPVRFGRLCAMPDGLGTALYASMAQGGSANDFSDLLEAGIPAWLPASRLRTLAAFEGWVDRMHSHLRRPGLGSGLERCLYEMNPDQPCLGQAVGAECVSDLEEMIAVLEDGARQADFVTSPLDLHAAAFLMSRLGRRSPAVAAAIVRDAATTERPLLELRLLAAVQQAVGDPPLPLLGRWLAHRVAPVVGRLHNLRQRERLATAVERRKESGHLADLLEILDDRALWQADEAGFAAARRQFHANRMTAIRLEEARPDLLGDAHEQGQQLAALLSVSLGAVVGTTLLLLQAG